MNARASKTTKRSGQLAWNGLARVLTTVGTSSYLPALVDLIGGLVPHDRVTVTRYIVDQRPEFLTHRNFSDDLAARYLEVYYPFDPFYMHWSRTQTTGVVPLARFSNQELKQGRYIAEFLAQSVIRDEVGIFLDDGSRATLGVFLERAAKPFSIRDIARLEIAFPALSALHALHRRLTTPQRPQRRPGRRSGSNRTGPPQRAEGLWPELTAREREVASLILAGHPSRDIAKRLGISPGTVRNHRLSIYAKLDITSEREVFLAYLDLIGGR
jgi:DNA-binding CsgD family transcriptional regulator